MNFIVYKITAKLWIYSDSSTWHFISLDKKISQEIKANQWFIKRGFGSVPVIVTIGKTKWKTSIFPQKSGEYILPVKAEVRKKENIKSEDSVSLTIKVYI